MASPAKLDVDEFGRLVRENVTDSDSSRDSSRRKRRRRDRKRSRSRSSSRSHRRRRERRERSRSFSPIRRRRSRSRSRTPVLRRRDKGSRNKGEEECFDFKMGKCYRGPNCRYSHNVNDDYMSGRDRLGRRKQTPHNHKEETDNLHPSTSSVHGDNVSIKDEELKLPLGIPDLKQVKLELPADNGNKVPQIDQECKTTVEDSLVYESFSPTEPPSAALTHIPTVKDHTTQNVNVQTTSVVSPMTISLTTEKVPSQSNLPLPPIPLNIPLAQPFSHDHNFRPPFNHKPDNYQPSQSPMPYYFAPPPPPPHFNSSMNMTQSWQNGLPSYAPITPYPTEFHSQSQPLQYQAYPTVHGPSQIPPSTDAYRSMSFPVSNMTGQQAMNLSHPVVQSQSNLFHSSIGVNMPSTINPSQSLPYQFNTYAAQPQSTNYDSNALIQGNDRQFNPMHGASVSLEAHKIGNVNPSSSSAQTDRPGYNQYDPLFDSMEPPSNSVTGAGFQNVEAIGDSDHFQKSNESSKVYDKGNIKQERDTAVSANESIDFEEFGETAGVVNRSSSTPNNAMDTPAGEIEIDQVKASGEKSRSTKLFKVSIAAFVKDVLKPSWRQGNMSKEAFKTIVKKTVDKVSGAMKSRKMPKSQAKVNQYIDSSRGKLTKLVMGYVDKYVKV